MNLTISSNVQELFDENLIPENLQKNSKYFSDFVHLTPEPNDEKINYPR